MYIFVYLSVTLFIILKNGHSVGDDSNRVEIIILKCKYLEYFLFSQDFFLYSSENYRNRGRLTFNLICVYKLIKANEIEQVELHKFYFANVSIERNLGETRQMSVGYRQSILLRNIIETSTDSPDIIGHFQ